MQKPYCTRRLTKNPHAPDNSRNGASHALPNQITKQIFAPVVCGGIAPPRYILIHLNPFQPNTFPLLFYVYTPIRA